MMTGRWLSMGSYDVKPLDGRYWLIQNLLGTWGFEFSEGANLYRIIPEHNVITDFASIPFRLVITRVFGPPTGYGKGKAYGPPAVMHDEGYRTGKVLKFQVGGGWKPIKVSRKFVDDMFEAAMHCEVSISLDVVVNIKPERRTYRLVDVTGWRRRGMYRAVRIGGGRHFRNHRKAEK